MNTKRTPVAVIATGQRDARYSYRGLTESTLYEVLNVTADGKVLQFDDDNGYRRSIHINSPMLAVAYADVPTLEFNPHDVTIVRHPGSVSVSYGSHKIGWFSDTGFTALARTDAFDDIPQSMSVPTQSGHRALRTQTQ